MIIMSSGMVCSFLYDYYVEWDGLFLLPVTGSYGAGVTIISEGQEMLDMQNIEHHMSTHILPLPGQTTVGIYTDNLASPPACCMAFFIAGFKFHAYNHLYQSGEGGYFGFKVCPSFFVLKKKICISSEPLNTRMHTHTCTLKYYIIFITISFYVLLVVDKIDVCDIIYVRFWLYLFNFACCMAQLFCC